jgi:hypothetical protein
VTFPSRTPSWGEIEKFCQIDGWNFVRSSGHSFYRKVLPSGETLETHTSFSGNKSMSHRVFSVILRTQLKVSRAKFWQALETGEPVERPVPEPEEVDVQHEAWVVFGLLRAGVVEAEIAGMSEEEARTRLHELWSKPQLG